MSRGPSVLCVGKATQDVFLRDDEFDPHCEGSVCYTHLPLGAKLDVSELSVSTGGNATNVAVTLARQDIATKYLWALGTDAMSEACLRVLDDEGVDTSGVVQDERFKVGYSAVLVAVENGERTILNFKGVSPQAADIERMLRLQEPVDWVYPSSVGSLDVLEKVVAWAEKHGAKVMLNPSGTELSDSQRLKALLAHVEVLCMNKEEMQQLVEGSTTEELVRHALHFCPVVVVTDGREGAVASDGITIVSSGLYDQAKPVERTGAGDAFASGFLSQWIVGKSLRESLVFASANSSSVVLQPGAKAGILQRGVVLHDMPIQERPLA
ncbi:MAG: carbohydrate kinase family protein [Acidobacteriota bacterium]